jgi:hypothetical protein
MPCGSLHSKKKFLSILLHFFILLAAGNFQSVGKKNCGSQAAWLNAWFSFFFTDEIFFFWLFCFSLLVRNYVLNMTNLFMSNTKVKYFW